VEAFIHDAVRTPRGKGNERGALAHSRPVELLRPLFHALAQRNGLDTETVDDVTLGCSTATGEQGANIAKAAAHFAGWDYRSSGGVVSRLCCSGLDAIATAAAKIDAGMDDLAVAGGVESMSRVPIFSDQGPLFADPEVAAAGGFVHMGVAADIVATLGAISREECDAYALESHRRAAAARDGGRFERSLVAVDGLDRDETIRDGQTADDLAALEPAFGDLDAGIAHQKLPHLGEIEHVHTIATAPQIVDGASLLLVGGEKEGARARIVSAANVGVKPPLLTATVPATQQALDRARMTLADVDLFEVNESFAAIVLHYLQHFGLDLDRVNVNGGAIAMGHPLGATGGMLAATLLDELERRDLEVGLLTIPAAAGIGAALVLQRI
jgi:acetyl-CoA C-acetyltransferase